MSLSNTFTFVNNNKKRDPHFLKWCDHLRRAQDAKIRKRLSITLCLCFLTCLKPIQSSLITWSFRS